MLGVAESERALEMADEASARFDVEAVVAHLSTALRGYTAVDAKCSAAMVCVRLGETLANALGNLTASRAWFARARRLVEHEPPCLEQGWVAVAAMGCDVVEPALLAEAMFHATCLAPHTARTLRALGDLSPTTLAIMHGSSFQGDGKQALYDLAAGYEKLMAEA